MQKVISASGLKTERNFSPNPLIDADNAIHLTSFDG